MGLKIHNNLRFSAEGAYWLYHTLPVSTGVYKLEDAWAVERQGDTIRAGCARYALFYDTVVTGNSTEALKAWDSPNNGVFNLPKLHTFFPWTLLITQEAYTSWFDRAKDIIDRYPSVTSVGYHHTLSGRDYWLPTFEGLSPYCDTFILEVDDYLSGLTEARIKERRPCLDLKSSNYYRSDLVGWGDSTAKFNPSITAPVITEKPKFELPREYTHGEPPMPKQVRDELHKAIAMRTLNGGPDSIFLGRKG